MTSLQEPRSSLESDPNFGPLKEWIVESTGLAYYLDKDVELTAQVGRRMIALGITDCGSYLELLRDGRDKEAERDTLTDGLTIGETFFFRHQEVFDALKNRVLPELIERNRQERRLRIWSAGCATGAEPYSLAILLQRDFGPQLADWDVTIVGTDINRDFLVQCQRGEFSEWAFRSPSDQVQRSCFTRSGQAWTINDEYRRDLLFQYHNLVRHPFPSLLNGLSAFDLILCRNVMLYFKPTVVPRLVGQFYECLVDGGWFVVGPTETNVEQFRAFETVNVSGAVLYRKATPPTVAASWASPSAVAPVMHTPIRGTTPVGSFASPDKTKTGIAAPRRRPHAPKRPGPTVPISATLADARAKLNCGQTEAAAACCRKLMAAEQLNPLVHFCHALIAEQQGHLGEVEAALRRAIYLDRDFVLAHYHLGLVLQRTRDRQAARRSLRNVLSLLKKRADAEIFPDADGLTVEELQQLARMHLEVLNRT
ncbi:MAG TPA: CheR family methyltransferase [Pirellulales bacterium]|jgi:chemotaxis protein methyltransferase CheR|nr:CheR family methyltransferase [Pirellulales bacterium]